MGNTDSLPLLFRTFRQREIEAKNRIVVSPMCQYSSDDGAPVDWHLVHLGRLAMGGAGIVFAEETAVEAEGRKTWQCSGLWTADQVPVWRRVTAMIAGFGALPAIQLGHSGRKGSCHGALEGWAPLTPGTDTGEPPWITQAPSALPAQPDHPTPREMTRDDIDRVVGAFAASARLALDAGFDIVEIHGAHGYLIHQFLSPLANRRRDAYGGDRSQRMRFALEIAEAVRAAWPQDKPLWWRASCVDGTGGAWNLDDTKALADALKLRGIDLIDCSSGGINGSGSMPPVPRTPGYQAAFAAGIRRVCGIATAAVGEITEPAQAEAILGRGDADVIAMARELMLDANWPARAARELGISQWWGVLPPAYAHRLEQRERVRRLSSSRGKSERNRDLLDLT